MKITEDILLNNGFHKYEKQLRDYMDWDEYILVINDYEFFINVRNISNMVGRDWSVHVDNSNADSIGIVDIDTVEHFNDFMALLDIDFKLK